MKKNILAFVLGMFVMGGIVVAAAALTSADIISYKTDKTVADALDEILIDIEILNSGTATSNDILSGKTATVNSELITGTMANNGAWTSTPTTKGNVTIPAGYHNGSGYVNTNSVYQAGYDAGYNNGGTNTNIQILCDVAPYSDSADNGINLDKTVTIDQDGVVLAFFENENINATYYRAGTTHVYVNGVEQTITSQTLKASAKHGVYDYFNYVFSVKKNDVVRFTYSVGWNVYQSQSYVIYLPSYH